MAPKINILMDRYGERGWTFSVHTNGETWQNGLPKPNLYRTGEEGLGLWQAQFTGEHYEDGSQRFEYVRVLEDDAFYLYPTERRAYDRIRYMIRKGVVK